MAERLPKEIMSLLKTVAKVADRQGVSAYVVGGFVRDLLLRIDNYDMDIVIEDDGIRFAKVLGFRTIVVDPREVFATRERFEGADQILVSWPEEVLPEIGLHGGSYMAILSHDLKIDVPALELALQSPARYIGVLGSKKTHAKRVAALREKGFDDEEIARIHSPIGLDLGGRRAEEIALSVIAEMVAVGHGRSTKSLSGE